MDSHGGENRTLYVLDAGDITAASEPLAKTTPQILEALEISSSSEYHQQKVIVKAQSGNVEQYPTEDETQDEDKQFTRQSKARFRRRINERWKCSTTGHTYCFANLDGVHEPLSEDAIDEWVSALHDGAATLLTPPTGLVATKLSPDRSDVISSISRKTIEYQRPFQWQANPSLTDLRSIQKKLRGSYHSSLASASSSTALSSSTASSGIPGIGYLSGKVVKWVGIQMLSSVVPLEIRRRRRIIHRLVTKIDELPVDERAMWMSKRTVKIKRAIEDLIELSSGAYKSEYQLTAIKQGATLQRYLYSSPFVSIDSQAKENLYSMSVQTLPLHLLWYDSGSEEFVSDFREVLLQNRSDGDDDDEWVMAELISQLCFELAFASASSWRHECYLALHFLYRTSIGRKHLRRLGKNSVLIENLARRAFDSTIPLPNIEHARSLDFFAEYANDTPTLRPWIDGTMGIPLLVQKIKAVESCMGTMCTVLSNLSLFSWCIPQLVELDICGILCKLVIINQLHAGTAQFSRSWLAFCSIRTLRNMVVYGGPSGRRAVDIATTKALQQILPNVEGIVRGEHGNTKAQKVRTWIEETWSKSK